MDRQKILLGVLSGVVTLAVLVFAYQYLMNKEVTNTESNKTEQAVVVPNTIEGVSEEIESQTTIDDVAIEAEISAETAAIEEDVKTLNNLSRSYDENQL
jgi:uncharacterized protein YaiI (UPF0178 family)